MVRKSGHPLGVTRAVLLGAAMTTVGMGLTSGVAATEPAANNGNSSSTADARPAPVTDVRSMTDRELGEELGRVHGKDSLREQEVVTEMQQRGIPMMSATPPTRGVGVAGGVPVRPGVSVTGKLGYDQHNGSWVTSGGVQVGKPSGPQFTGIAPKPDGLNAEANANVDLGEHAEFSSRFTFNVAPDLSVTGSYKAKGTVTTPDGRSYEMEVTVERRADGTWHVDLPDGVTTSTPLPGGGTVETKTPTDPTAEPAEPEVKGPAPTTGKKSESWVDFGAGVSVDKEFRPAPLPPPTAEELDRAKRDWAEQQAQARQQQDNWMAQNRPEAVRREALEPAEDQAPAAEATHREPLPDTDQDGHPDGEDPTPNQNDTDPTSTDLGDGPEGGEGYAGSSGPTSSEPAAATESGPNTGGDSGSYSDTGSSSDTAAATDSSSLSAATDSSSSSAATDSSSSSAATDSSSSSAATDSSSSSGTTDSSSTDSHSGSGSGSGESGSTDASGASGSSDAGGFSGSDAGGYAGSGDGSSGDADGDGLSGAADATPNQNDTDPASTDVGDGPEGGAGYGGSTDAGGYGSDPGAGDCTCF